MGGVHLTISSAIVGVTPAMPLLPMTHVTSYATFEDAIRRRVLPLNSTCPRRGRPATYLFYGAPFYRLPKRVPHELDIDDVDKLPIAVLIPSSQMTGVRAEIFPFDTGAWARGLYAPHLTPIAGSLDEFATESVEAPTDAAKLVRLLFNTNHSYITGRNLRAPLDSDNSAVKSVKAVHQAKLQADVRRRGIEIVALEEVGWLADGLVVIGPRFQLASRRKLLPELDALLGSPATTVLHYSDMMPFSPTSDSRAVLDHAVAWLLQEGFLQEAP